VPVWHENAKTRKQSESGVSYESATSAGWAATAVVAVHMASRAVDPSAESLLGLRRGDRSTATPSPRPTDSQTTICTTSSERNCRRILFVWKF
jgi:hypothetical protein